MMSRVVRFCFFLSILVFSQTSIRAQVFVNEFHYDNTPNPDVNEFIEIVGLAGTNLAGYSIYMYNGSDGTTYSSFPLSGVIPNQCTVGGNNIGTLVFDVAALTMLSFQNGAPDGFALVDPSMNVIEFLSYEGGFTATDGPANTLNSTDVVVFEDGTGTATGSIQRTGASSWTVSPTISTFGACNTSQYFPASSITVNLSVSSNTGSEATGATPITVTATTSANVTGNQTVNLAVAGPFVTAGDYSLSNTVITIPNGSNTGSVTFNVVNDAIYEGLEIATLSISSPSSGIVLGGTTSRNISITDNDTKPNYEVWSNEIHYDNMTPDGNEKIEIAGASGTNLAGWSIYLYDGTTFNSPLIFF